MISLPCCCAPSLESGPTLTHNKYFRPAYTQTPPEKAHNKTTCHQLLPLQAREKRGKQPCQKKVPEISLGQRACGKISPLANGTFFLLLWRNVRVRGCVCPEKGRCVCFGAHLLIFFGVCFMAFQIFTVPWSLCCGGVE